MLVLLIIGYLLTAQTFAAPYTESFPFGDVTQSSDIYQKAWAKNCSDEARYRCPSNLYVGYVVMEPFVMPFNFSTSEFRPAGLLTGILLASLSQCCGSCTTIRWKRLHNNSHILSELDIRLPSYRHGGSKSTGHHLSVLDIPGATFLTTADMNPADFAKDILSSVFEIWPLLFISILLAGMAGVIMWFLDTWYNITHFPREFLRGSFEGFWWAFISMTTVGYGDRAPISLTARIFAVIWILAGITITSLITATLMSAITQVAENQRATINSGKIGLLSNRSFEGRILEVGTAIKIHLPSVDELLRELKKSEIDGFVLDSYTMKYHQAKISESSKIRVASTIANTDQSTYGIVIENQTLFNSISGFISHNKEEIDKYTSNYFEETEKIEVVSERLGSLFALESGLFFPTLYICLTFLAIAALMGVVIQIAQRMQYRKKRRISVAKMQKKRNLTREWTARFVREMEEQVTQDVKDVFARWEHEFIKRLSTTVTEQINVDKYQKTVTIDLHSTVDSKDGVDNSSYVPDYEPTRKTPRALPKLQESHMMNKIENSFQPTNGYVDQSTENNHERPHHPRGSGRAPNDSKRYKRLHGASLKNRPKTAPAKKTFKRKVKTKSKPVASVNSDYYEQESAPEESFTWASGKYDLKLEKNAEPYVHASFHRPAEPLPLSPPAYSFHV